MAYFTWEDSFSVSIKEIDDQHKKIFTFLNELSDAMKDGRGKEIIERILAGLIEYTKTHFANEERLMKDSGYPGYILHKEKHDTLTRKAVEFEEAFKKGSLSVSVEVSGFLKDWLKTHILGTDKQYSPFLNGKGIR